MNKIIVSTIAAAGLALSASSAFAHGHVVTGAQLYATPETSQAAAPASQTDNGVQPHKTRIIRHGAHSLRTNAS
jgi:hypothetical protein